jgi:hypothetical protein
MGEEMLEPMYDLSLIGARCRLHGGVGLLSAVGVVAVPRFPLLAYHRKMFLAMLINQVPLVHAYAIGILISLMPAQAFHIPYWQNIMKTI